MPDAADLNRGVARVHDALARRLPRLADVHATALRALALRVAHEMTATSGLTAAIWQGPTPEAMTAELRNKLDAAWADSHAGTIQRVRSEAWRVTIASLGTSLGVNFNLANPVLEGAFRTIANRTDIGDSAWALIGESLQGSYDSGAGIPQAARDLRTTVAGMAPVRARTIARTEMISTSNLGSLAAARAVNSGAPEGEGVGFKTWLATNDDRTRETHAEAAGQTVPIDDRFSVGGEEMDYPGDPSASAAETANCRCTILFDGTPDGFTGDMGSDALLAGATRCTCARAG